MAHSAVATLFSNSAPFLLLTPSRSRVLECFELATDPLSSVHPAFCIVHSVLCGCISFARRRAEQWYHYISRWSGIYLSHVARHSHCRYCFDRRFGSFLSVSRSLKGCVMYGPRAYWSRNRQHSETMLVWFSIPVESAWRNSYSAGLVLKNVARARRGCLRTQKCRPTFA